MKWTYGILLMFAVCWLPAAEIRFRELSIAPFVKGETAKVEFQNLGQTEQALSGWSLWDGRGHSLVIPDGVMLAGGEVLPLELPSGMLSDRFLEECALYSAAGRSSAILEDCVQWGHRIYQKGRKRTLNKNLIVLRQFDESAGAWRVSILVFGLLKPAGEFQYQLSKARDFSAWEAEKITQKRLWYSEVPNGKYYYRVREISPGREGRWSDPQLFRVNLLTPCQKPSRNNFQPFKY